MSDHVKPSEDDGGALRVEDKLEASKARERLLLDDNRELREENEALKLRVASLERRYAEQPPAAPEPERATQTLLAQLHQERERSAGLQAQCDAQAQLLRDVLAAPIREAKYALEPAGGWVRWHARATGVA